MGVDVDTDEGLIRKGKYGSEKGGKEKGGGKGVEWSGRRL